MKRFRLFQFATSFFISANLVAHGGLHNPHTTQLITAFDFDIPNEEEPVSKGNEEKLIIESSRFTAPLAKKWASEYEKNNPGVKVVFVESDSPEVKADLSLVSSSTNEKSKGSKFIHAGRFALLPVTNSRNPFLNELNKKRLDSKGIRELFFGNDRLDGGSGSSNEPKYEFNIYSGNNSDSYADVLASHFGFLKADIKGKRISGDDIYLINAIQKDNEGITYNYLNYIFDTNTRGLKDGLALVPLDVKKEFREVLSEEDIDKTISLLENEKISLIPVEDIGFVTTNNSDSVKKFIDWVLTEGQKFNNEYGFLRVTFEQLANN